MFENIKKDTDNLQIRLLAGKIKEKFNPQRIILFGSFAYGVPKKESDIDFLVIMKTNLKPYKQASSIRLFLDETFEINCPIDIIVRTPETIKKRLFEGDFFIKKILQEGVQL